MTTPANGAMAGNWRRLILFGRYPVPGQTKTRLIPELGPVGAAHLQKQLTRKSLDTLLAAQAAPVELCYTGGSRNQMHRWLRGYPITLAPQSEGHLGQRMHAAMTRALRQGCRQVVLVGTDIPDMQADHIQAAFEALETNDLVIGPSQDGGYWLVGLRREANIFEGIDWGSADVFNQTVAAARRQGLSITTLDKLNDIDNATDLAAWSTEQQWPSPYLSIVIPALNEADAIAATIASARCDDSEIIVVDGGSRDRTMAVAKESGAQVIQISPGRSGQQNAGARIARGRVLLFAHADTHLPEHYADHVFEILMDPKVVGGAFGFKTDYDHWGMRLIEKIVQIRCRLFQLPYGDQALFMPKSVFKKVGGFPPAPIAEDLFLVRRLARIGRIGLVPKGVVTSGRRWRTIGLFRTTVINAIIACGCLAGVPPKYLAPLYRWWIKP